MSIEVMKQALEALEPVSTYGRVGSKDTDTAKAQQAITALRQAIEQAEQYNATSDRVLMENAQGDLERVTLVQTGVGIGKAEQAQPVAYRCWNNPKNADGTYGVVRVWISGKPEGDGNEPLYTASPPRQPWVGLTGDEVNEFAAGCHLGNSVQGAIRKAEAKIKEKNT